MRISTSQRGNALQVIVWVLVVVWIAGTSITGMYYNYAQKRQCIQDEGWVKGWFWCSTETRYSFAFNMLRGLVWPIEVMNSFSNAGQQVSPQLQMTQEQFDRSRVGTMYTCWAVALRTRRDGDTEVLSRVLAWMKKDDPTMESQHIDYMSMAGLQVQRIEAREGFENYYRIACAEPVAKMQKAITQGMIK